MRTTTENEIYDRGMREERDHWLAQLDMFQARFPEESIGWSVLEGFRKEAGYGE